MVNQEAAIHIIAADAANLRQGSHSFADHTGITLKKTLKNNIHHSVCKWPFEFLPFEELCNTIKSFGVNAIDLLKPDEWPIAKKHGLYVSMCYTAGETSLTEGFNHTENHKWLVPDYTEAIGLVAKAGYKNLICFSGNRNGMDDETGLRNCVEGIKKILPLAEKNNVVLLMELFNSKLDHPDYMCDNTQWAIELCKQIDSENFKLLYDIYHMQVNEGNVIATIKENHTFFGHYHVAGVPGRHEPDHDQELNYSAVMKAIAETGFKGYVAQEFISKGKDTATKLKGLKEAVSICDV